MCGICGFSGKTDRTVLEKMTEALYHRGPDECGYYADGEINLGVRRLSIIDLETGHQPIHNEDKTIWAVFNGEIYNFQELRKNLKEKGHILYTDHSDSEVIVHLYEDYGIEFVHKLNGMFAIAIWDKQNRSLILIRDRMGVKPLFYALVDGLFIFASEIKSILSHPRVLKQPNYEAIYHYFTFKNIPSPFTAFAKINSLLPGELIKFSNGNISKHRWWKIKFQEDKNLDEENVRERILYLLEDAVKIRMISDVPFGAYLSGGVDSSTVVAFMVRFSRKPIKTFSLGYEDDFKNKEADLYFARKVSKIFNTEHYEYIMSQKELVSDLGKIIEAFDQPFSGTISTYFLTKLISKHVKVALTGDASDELFGSYLSHRLAQPMEYFRNRYLATGCLDFTEQDLSKVCDPSFFKELFYKSKGDEIRWRYLLYPFLDEEKSQLLTEDFKSNLDGVSSFSLLKEYFKDLTAKDSLNRILEMEWNSQLPDQVLAFVDFLSMAHSVEIRSPFLDYRLVEFVATVPGYLKIKDGNVKDILKKTVKNLLPKEIIDRPKEGFVLPVFNWMEDKLKSYCLSLLSKDRLKKHNFFNESFVENLLKEYYSGKKNLAGKIWTLVCFQIWWEKYFS